MNGGSHRKVVIQSANSSAPLKQTANSRQANGPKKYIKKPTSQADKPLSS